jgi:predicted small lipoprotein YifL
MRTLPLIFALTFAVTLAACGYKTPLALPKPKPEVPAAKAVPAQPSTPAPDAQKPETK